jgi:hypothetical protein
MKVVTNAEELTIEILDQLSRILNESFELYSYKIESDGTIKLSSEGGYVLGITNNTIEVRDVIQDAYLDTLAEVAYEARIGEYSTFNQIIKELGDTFNDPLMSTFMSNQYNSLVGVPEKHITYKTFHYFSTEEQWFQQMTVLEDVLPFECLTNIQRIKEAVLKDLKKKWMMD